MSMRCVAGETLCRTTQCPREFVCLENHSRPPCIAIGSCAEGLVIEKANHSRCAYAARCDGSAVCTCPTRAELRERYGW